MRARLRLLRHANLRLARKLRGIEAVNRWLAQPGGGTAAVLQAFGADVGDNPTIYGPLTIHNARADYGRLTIGDRVHIGRGVFLDLTDNLTIEDDATVSMGCTILTHQDIGDRPLAAVYPRLLKPTTIGAGAYLGANVTVLCGCHIGVHSTVGAGAVVTEPVPPGVVVAGVPARIVKRLPIEVARRYGGPMKLVDIRITRVEGRRPWAWLATSDAHLVGEGRAFTRGGAERRAKSALPRLADRR